MKKTLFRNKILTFLLAGVIVFSTGGGVLASATGIGTVSSSSIAAPAEDELSAPADASNVQTDDALLPAAADVKTDDTLPPAADVKTDDTLPPAAVVKTDDTLPPAAAVKTDDTLPPAADVKTDDTLPPAAVVKTDDTLPPAAVVKTDDTLPPAADVKTDDTLPPAAVVKIDGASLPAISSSDKVQLNSVAPPIITPPSNGLLEIIEPKVEFTASDLDVIMNTPEFTLLEGVFALDENGNTLNVTVQSDGGFDVSAASSYDITYVATHPLIGEVTAVRTVTVVEQLFVYDAQPVSKDEIDVIVAAFEEDPFAAAMPKWKEAIDAEWVPETFTLKNLIDEETGASYYMLVVNLQRSLYQSGTHEISVDTLDDLNNDLIDFASSGNFFTAVVNLNPALITEINALTDPFVFYQNFSNKSVIFEVSDPKQVSPITLKPANNQPAFVFEFDNFEKALICFNNIDFEGSAGIHATTDTTYEFRFKNITFKDTTSQFFSNEANSNSDVKISDSQFDNALPVDAAGKPLPLVLVNGGKLSVTNTSFNNTFSAIQLPNKGELEVLGSTFNNIAQGHAINLSNSFSGNLIVKDSQFTNIGDRNVYPVGNASGIVIGSYADATALIENSIFENIDALTSDDHGAAIKVRFNKKDVTINSCTFKNNKGSTYEPAPVTGWGAGGAIGFYETNAESVLNINNSLFENNNSDRFGGAVGFYQARGTATIKNSTFNENKSTKRGGAIGVLTNSTNEVLTLNIEGSTFYKNNSKDNKGHAMFLEGANNNSANLNIQNSTFSENSSQTIRVSLGINANIKNNTFYQRTGFPITRFADGARIPKIHLTNNLFSINSTSNHSLTTSLLSDDSNVYANKSKSSSFTFADIASDGLTPILAENGTNIKAGANGAIGKSGKSIATATPVLSLLPKAHTYQDVAKAGYKNLYADGMANPATALATDQHGNARSTIFPSAGAIEIPFNIAYAYNLNGGETTGTDDFAPYTFAPDGTNNPSTTFNLPKLAAASTSADSSGVSVWSAPANLYFVGWAEEASPADPASILAVGNSHTLSTSGILSAINGIKTVRTYSSPVLYAQWSSVPQTHTVTFVTNDDATIALLTVNDGDAVAKPENPTKAGHSFGGWYTSAALTTEYDFTSLVTGDITLYGSWNINSYEVTFVTNGDTAISPITANHNTRIAAPTNPTKAGYSFGKWYTNAALTTEYDFTGFVTGDITLYGSWNINSYEVTFVTNGDTAISPITANHNTRIAAPTNPTKAGYSFGKWYTNAALTTEYDFTSLVTGDITLYGSWNINSYEVTFNVDGGSTVANAIVEHGATTAKPANPTKTGNNFGGWYTDVALTSEYDFSSPITSDITLYASWNLNSYTVTFNTNGGTAITNETITFGGKVTKPANPTKTGNSFGGWYTDVALTSEYDFSDAVTANTTLYASWNLNSYTVSYNTNGGTAIANETITFGGKVTKPANPTKTGNNFGGWYANSALTNAWSFDSAITKSTTLYAKWNDASIPAVAQYTVTFNVDGGSTVANAIVEHGATVTKPANPTKTGSTFGGWYANSALTNAWNFDSAITKNTTLYAKWNDASIPAVAQYTVTFNADGGSAVNSITVDAGNTLANAPSTSRANYIFAGWFKADGTAWAFSTNGDKVNSNITLNAKWKAVVVAPINPPATVNPVTPPPTTTVVRPPVRPVVPGTLDPVVDVETTETTQTPETPKTPATAPSSSAGSAASSASIMPDDAALDTDKLLDGSTPMVAPNTVSTWSLLNLILSIIMLCASIVLLVGIIRKGTDAIVMRLLAVVAGASSIIIFFITSNVRTAMQFTDEWSLPIILLLVAQILFVVLMKRFSRKNKHTSEE